MILVGTSMAVGLLSALLCGLFARGMKRRSIGQQIREIGPSHQQKAGTPTMGGCVVVALWLAGVVLVRVAHPLDRRELFVVAAGLILGGIGALDDLLSLRRKHSMGLSGWQKIVLVSLAAAILFWIFRRDLPVSLFVPFSSRSVALPPVAQFLLTWAVLLATSNAVNLTDGLDGLAGGVGVLILAGFLILLPSAANVRLLLPFVAALLGFLWHNGHPARLFLGDVGAFALGGVIAGFALVSGTALLLPLMAGIPALEALSDILQVASCRLTGKRLFRMAPLHHHFEATSSPLPASWLRAPRWPESLVTLRFCLVQVLFVAVALLAGNGLR